MADTPIQQRLVDQLMKNWITEQAYQQENGAVGMGDVKAAEFRHLNEVRDRPIEPTVSPVDFMIPGGAARAVGSLPRRGLGAISKGLRGSGGGGAVPPIRFGGGAGGGTAPHPDMPLPMKPGVPGGPGMEMADEEIEALWNQKVADTFRDKRGIPQRIRDLWMEWQARGKPMDDLGPLPGSSGPLAPPSGTGQTGEGILGNSVYMRNSTGAPWAGSSPGFHGREAVMSEPPIPSLPPSRPPSNLPGTAPGRRRR